VSSIASIIRRVKALPLPLTRLATISPLGTLLIALMIGIALSPMRAAPPFLSAVKYGNAGLKA